MLDLYDLGGGRWTELIDLTREARQRGWWRAYGLDDRGYVPLEAEATLVREVTLAYVPGLMQTTDYARALFRANLHRWPETQLENKVTVRMIRQERLTSEEQPLQLVAIVDEPMLHRPVGGPGVMRAQLGHIVTAAALDSVTFQVLPTGAGAHPSMSGGFTLLSFGDLGEPDLAYVEHPLGGVHLEKEADVARAKLMFDYLRSVALSPADSVTARRAGGRADVEPKSARRCPMPTPIPVGLTWRKSSFSGQNGNSDGCVEVAFLPGGGVAIRDTKDRTASPHRYTAAEWDAFIAGVRAREFDRP